MVTKKNKYNPRRIKKKRSYFFSDIADLLGIHLRTVHIWKKEGLKILDKQKPYLVMGNDLREFLKDRAKKRKKPLQIGECYCPRCRCPRKSKEPLRAELTGRSLGMNSKQIILKGICEVCSLPMNRFSSDRNVSEMVKAGAKITELQRVITGSEIGSINTDMKGVRENA